MRTYLAAALAVTAFLVLLAVPASSWPGDPYPNRITAHDAAHHHRLHGHAQWQGGEGEEGHTWAAYRAEAAAARQFVRALLLRRYLIAVYVYRVGLVGRWSGVAECESGGNWSINTGNGYYGGLQFTLGTWAAYGGTGMPNEQPSWVQAQVADRVRVGGQGLGAWPVCGAYYG